MEDRQIELVNITLITGSWVPATPGGDAPTTGDPPEALRDRELDFFFFSSLLICKNIECSIGLPPVE